MMLKIQLGHNRNKLHFKIIQKKVILNRNNISQYDCILFLTKYFDQNFLSILIKNKTFEQYSVNDRELTQFPQNFIL